MRYKLADVNQLDDTSKNRSSFHFAQQCALLVAVLDAYKSDQKFYSWNTNLFVFLTDCSSNFNTSQNNSKVISMTNISFKFEHKKKTKR